MGEPGEDPIGLVHGQRGLQRRLDGCNASARAWIAMSGCFSPLDFDPAAFGPWRRSRLVPESESTSDTTTRLTSNGGEGGLIGNGPTAKKSTSETRTPVTVPIAVESEGLCSTLDQRLASSGSPRERPSRRRLCTST